MTSTTSPINSSLDTRDGAEAGRGGMRTCGRPLEVAAGDLGELIFMRSYGPPHSHPIMLSRGRPRRLSSAGRFAIEADRVAQAVVDGPGIKQRFDEGLTVPHRQFEPLVLLDRPPRCILHARQDEIGDGPALKSGGPLNEGLLLPGHPRLQTLGPGATAI